VSEFRNSSCISSQSQAVYRLPRAKYLAVRLQTHFLVTEAQKAAIVAIVSSTVGPVLWDYRRNLDHYVTSRANRPFAAGRRAIQVAPVVQSTGPTVDETIATIAAFCAWSQGSAVWSRTAKYLARGKHNA